MTVFDLLKHGCEIIFPSGYVLKGDPDTGYIECAIDLAGERHPDGVRLLDKKGVADALKDAKYHADQNK